MKGHLTVIVLAITIILLIPDPWLQGIARGVLLVLLASWLIARYQKRRIVLESQFNTVGIFAYERQEMQIRIENSSRLPIRTLAVNDEPGGLHLESSCSLTTSMPGSSRVVLSYLIWSEQRGLYRPGPLNLVALDPLGFFPWEKKVVLPRSVIVYPRIVDNDLALVRGALGSIKNSWRIEHQDQLETRSVRPYQNGDELRSIHWKQTARHGNLIVREYPMRQIIPFSLLLNLRHEDYHPKRLQRHLERMIELTCSLLVESHKEGLESDFHFLAKDGLSELDDIPILEGVASTLAHLALMNGANNLPTIADKLGTIRLSGLPHLILISPSLDPADFAALERIMPKVRSIRWFILDEQVERPGRITIEEAKFLEKLTIYRVLEHRDVTSEVS